MSLSIPWTTLSRFLTLPILSALLLLPARATDAQDLSCPTNGLVFIPDTGGNCGRFVWPPGLCYCGSSLFVVACTGGSGGTNGGCLYHCSARQTEEPCVAVELTGTPPPPPPGAPAPPQPPSCTGLPVSVTTGEVFFTHTDGRVGEIELTRTYNSARASALNRYGVLGPGWNMSLDVRLNILSTANPKAVEIRLPDGTPIYYVDKTIDAPDVYTQELPGSNDSWIETTPTGFRRVLRRGGSETYDSAGRLLLVTDPSGRETVYGRDGQGRLTTITRDNRAVTLVYVSVSGAPTRLDRVLGPDGVTPLVAYTYEFGWRLKAVDYPGVPNGGYRFHFDSGNANARISRVTDAAVPPNPIEAHLYDGEGRATTSEIADGQEKLIIEYPTSPSPSRTVTGQTRVTDARANVTLYDWIDVDHVRRVTKVVGPCSGCGGGTGETRAWLYDSKGRIVRYVDASGTTNYTYDQTTGDLLTESKPLSHTTTYTYWPDGRVRKHTRPNGGFTEFTYVPAGPDIITETVEPPPGSLRVTDLDYDSVGRLEWITDPRGKRTQFTYDTRSDLVAVTDPLGTPTPDPNDHVTRFEYDDFGRRTAVVNPLGHRTETHYDGRGNVLWVRQFDGSRPIDTTFTYSPAGRRETATDPNGRITDYQYDTYGRLRKVFQPVELGVRPVTEYGYDVMSNLTSITDAEGRVTTFLPDAYNRVEKITYPGQREENFTFDASGRLWTRTRGGVTTTYGYDALNRLTSKTFSDGTPAYSYVYDENGDLGFLTSATHGGRTLRWNYDLAGQLRSEVSLSASGPTDTVSYTYDLAGNRESLSLNGTAWLTYDYDDASRLDKIHRGAEVFDFGYDDAHRRTGLDYPNLVHTGYGYDTLSRPRSLATTRNQTAISSTAYTYDDAGNRLTKAHPGLYAESYLYDPLDRLRQVTRDTTISEQYTYDKVGNRNRPPWTYSDRNELMSNGVNTFDYDLRGNLTMKVDGADTWIYEWTAENQLKRVLKNGSEVARYTYDPLGRRIERTAGVVLYQYVYDGEDVLREDFSSPIEEEGMVDPPPHLYVHGPGIDEPLAVKHGNDARWHYHADGLGSVLGATDINGQGSHWRQYDAFGNPQDGADEQGYAFTGREWDPQTGLYYYRARYYDPKIGRFISEDPVPLQQRATDELNAYGYVANNPVNWADPFGLAAMRNDSGRDIPYKPEICPGGNCQIQLCKPGETCDADGVYPPDCKSNPIKVVNGCTAQATAAGKLVITCAGVKSRMGQLLIGGSVSNNFMNDHPDWPPPNQAPGCQRSCQ